MSKSNPYLIVKSNRLINAHLNGLTLSQLRFFELLVAQLDREQDKFQKQRIYLSDFVIEIGTKNKNEYQRAREITKSMMKHVIEIFDEKEGLMQRNIFHSIDYPPHKPYVEVVFHPHLLPYLLQLKEKFTSYDIRNTLPLNSVYAVQIYQLLKQYLNIGEREFVIKDLKKILGVENKYKLYADFKKRVILTSQRELTKNCDLTFEFAEIKRGRKVHAIRFLIRPQQPKIKGSSQLEIKSASANGRQPAGQAAELSEGMASIGLSAKQIAQFLSEEDAPYLAELLEYTRLNAISNPAGFFVKLLKERALVKIKEPPAKKARPGKQPPAKEELKLIENLRDSFEEVRDAQIEKIIKEATEEDWLQFEKYAGSNSLVRSKVFKNGKINRKEKQTLFWFRVFLSDRLPDAEQAFADWALKTRGYQLEIDPREKIFRVSGKQNTFF